MEKVMTEIIDREQDSWQRSTLTPIPVAVHNDTNPVLPLEFRLIDSTSDFTYICQFRLPEQFVDKYLLLRFDGCGGYSQILLNGKVIGGRNSAYTAWQCSMPSYSEAEDIELTIVVSEDNLLSPYVDGSLIRNVFLVALPECHIEKLDIKPIVQKILSSDFVQANVALRVVLSGNYSSDVVIQFELRDSKKHLICSYQKSHAGTGECHFLIDDLQVCSWDSERPVLYKAHIRLLVDSEIKEEIEQTVAFASVEIVGNMMLVNDRPVKLRGICYQSAAPNTGKSVSRELLEQDLSLMQEANVNFIRMAHFPADEYMFELCDRAGIYVQVDAAISKVDWGGLPSQNMPEHYEKYMQHIADLYEQFRNHPCVLIWNLGSECSWGSNFRSAWNFLKTVDGRRAISFSYPMTMQESDMAPDLWSVHHVDSDLDFSAHYDHMIIGHTHGSDSAPGYALGMALDMKMPVLHDEIAHIPCYDRDMLKHDPGVREFWGQSISRIADKLLNSNGCLGGAVWSFCDAAGTEKDQGFEWGIVDIFRNKKPEFYHLKQAYAKVNQETSNEQIDFPAMPQVTSGAVLSEDEETICVRSAATEFVFNRKSCMLVSGKYDGRTIIERGPYIHMHGIRLPEAEGLSIAARKNQGLVDVRIRQRYGDDLEVIFSFVIGDDGLFEVSYEITKMLLNMPWTVKANVGLDMGGLSEYGFKFLLAEGAEELSWINAVNGSLSRGYAQSGAETELALYGKYDVPIRGTNKFRSMKQNIWFAQCGKRMHGAVSVFSDGSHSVRAQIDLPETAFVDDRDPRINYQGDWYAVEDISGCYAGTEMVSNQVGASAEIEFYGSGIVWLASTDMINGFAEIYLDGVLQSADIDLFPNDAEFPGMSRGYEKRYRNIAWSIQGLEEGWHKLKIVPAGRRNVRAQDNYISIDAFIILDEKTMKRNRTWLHVNSDLNYPRLVFGNYRKPPIYAAKGDNDHVLMQLGQMRLAR